MEATANLPLKSLAPYRHLFPKATGIDHTVQRGATVADTVKFMPQAARLSRWMVSRYVQAELQHLPLFEACQKLWHFVKQHIRYERDDAKKHLDFSKRELREQVRSPRRLIADGKGDCDCMTNFVNACMLEYGIKGQIVNRITAYDGNTNFQHIYSLIPDGKGRYIIMDCVWNHFNTEKQYSKKQDHPMELQFLDGHGESESAALHYSGNTSSPLRKTPQYTTVDQMDLFGLEALEEEDEADALYGKKRLFSRGGGSGGSSSASKPRKPLFQKRSPERKQAAKDRRRKFGAAVKKVANKVNKINPATALMRTGLLAALKLNMLNLAKSLRWGYASRELAQSRGMDMSKYDKLKQILQKTESIAYAAGANPQSVRVAILTGKGNPGRGVAGLDALNGHSSLSAILGAIYTEELVWGMDGFEGFGALDATGLGEPATATAIASATATLGVIAALLKQLGELFPAQRNTQAPRRKVFQRKAAASQQTTPEEQQDSSTEEQNTVQEQEQASEQDSSGSEQNNSSETDPAQTESSPETNQEAAPNTPNESPYTEDGELKMPSEYENSDNAFSAEQEQATEGLAGVLTSVSTFYQNNKNWIKPAAISIGIGGALALMLHYFSKHKPSRSTTSPSPINGTGGKQKAKGVRSTENNPRPSPAKARPGVIRLM